MTGVLMRETEGVLRHRQKMLHQDRDGSEVSTSQGHLEPPEPGRGKEVSSRAGEVVTAGQYLDCDLLAQSRSFALATPSACDTFSSLPPSVGLTTP